MPNQPIDLRPKQLNRNSRQAVWNEIRRLRTFTVADAAGYGNSAKKEARKYIEALCKAGICEHLENTAPMQFRLVRDWGEKCPRVRDDGSIVGQDRGQLNMWRSMRMLPSFNAQDIALHSTTEETDVKLATAKTYIKHLLAAGYLRVLQKAKGGPGGRLATYRLIRDTGPLPPKIQRVKQVYDANTKTVVYCPGDHNEL